MTASPFVTTKNEKREKGRHEKRNMLNERGGVKRHTNTMGKWRKHNIAIEIKTLIIRTSAKEEVKGTDGDGWGWDGGGAVFLRTRQSNS